MRGDHGTALKGRSYQPPIHVEVVERARSIIDLDILIVGVTSPLDNVKPET